MNHNESGGKNITVLIVEDHAIASAGLKFLLDQQNRFDVLGVVERGGHAGGNYASAVDAGFIALAGVAAETGVIMPINPDQALNEMPAKSSRPGARKCLTFWNKSCTIILQWHFAEAEAGTTAEAGPKWTFAPEPFPVRLNTMTG